MKKEKAASLTKEKKKLKDPDYLKAQTQPSPFSWAENVDFMKKEHDETKINKHLYIPLRYAKLTTSGMKRLRAMFRQVSPVKKQNYRNLDKDGEDYMHNLRI